jgi:drug/metabolite transporter (DMT)-like permease
MTAAQRAAARPRASIGAAMLLGSAFCYGVNIPFARMAAQLGVPGPDVVVFRVAIMLGLLAAFVAFGRHSVRVAPRERMGLFGLSLATALLGLAYISSVSFIPVGIAVLIFYTFPLLILAATPFVDGTRLSPRQIGACVIAFAGIGLAIGPSFGALDWRGLALAALASVAAVTQLFIASRAPGGGGLATMFWVHTAILPVSAGVLAFIGGPAPLADFQSAAAPVLVTTLFYLIGVAFQFLGLRRTSAASAGLIYCLEPVVAVAAAALLLGERLTLTQYAGAALVLLAVAASLTPGAAHVEAAA